MQSQACTYLISAYTLLVNLNQNKQNTTDIIMDIHINTINLKKTKHNMYNND